MVDQARKYTAVERSAELQKLWLPGQRQRHDTNFSSHNLNTCRMRKAAGSSDCFQKIHHVHLKILSMLMV